jgi:NDP-sugar pyrophosphorylase family protein
MKGLILSGGKGTRLYPITFNRAKQLVPVANTPILHYGIRSMVAAGITELGVIVGDTRDEVMADLGDGSKFGASITFIPQDEPLGLAHCVLIARDFLGDDDFIMYLGDNLLEQDLEAFVDAFNAERTSEHPPSAQILLKEVSDPHRFGIASLDGAGNVVHLVEKPVDPPSNLALVGVYLFDREIHEAVAAIERTLHAHNVPYVLGKTWTTDAIFRETPAKVQLRKSEGCLTVEMEAAAFCAVAQFRGVTFAQMLYGGDDVSGIEWDERAWNKRQSVRGRLFWLAAEACLKI